MFCPNCGAQNNDEVLNCQKCGFKIKESPASKFKGTMLMMNAPAGIQGLQQPGGTPGGTPPLGAPPAAAPPPGVAPTAPMAGSVAANNPPVAPAVGPKANFKGTMIGVAPPSLGGPATPAVAPTAAINFSKAPATAPASPGAMAAGVAPPLSPVNPLGGTLVAGDARALGVHAMPSTSSGQGGGPQATAPSPAVAAASNVGPQNFGGDAFGSTLPSGKDAPAFSSTTPSAGQGPANFGGHDTRPMTQAPAAGGSQAVLITLIVVLMVSLAALVWTVLR